MSVWFKKDLQLSDFTHLGNNTMSEYLGIRFTALGENYIQAEMPVDHRTKQPYGLLHGGASVALAETLGSIGSALVIDTDHWICVGQEINANHIRSARQGWVIGTASPIHLGAASHVWEIWITDEAGKLICISRLTVAILKKR